MFIPREISMKLLRAIIVIFLYFFLANAQDSSTSTRHGPLELQPSVAIVIGVLVTLFTITVLVFLYTKFCYRNVSILLHPGHNLHQLLRSRSSLSGIDRSLIESIPFFTFSTLKGFKEGLECSICLSMFEESEVLRLLPKCKHAFHMDCIDEWLESHSSCPLCRYRFDSTDFSSFIYTSSLRYNGNSTHFNLMDSPSLELFVEREEDRHGSIRFNFGNSFRKLSKSRNEDRLALENDICNKFHKFKHKIIVSETLHKRRWSDISSSDLLLLNSEMINVVSSKRFNSNSPKYGSLNEQISKIKEDMERKRIFESKRDNANDENTIESSRQVPSLEKRSMSEITILTRCKDFCARSNRYVESLSSGNNSRDERTRRLWLPIARQTLQWFAGRENNIDKSDMSLRASNV